MNACPSTEHSCRGESFEAAHRPYPGLQSSVIGLDRIVRVLLHDMTRGGQQLIDNRQTHQVLT